MTPEQADELELIAWLWKGFAYRRGQRVPHPQFFGEWFEQEAYSNPVPDHHYPRRVTGPDRCYLCDGTGFMLGVNHVNSSVHPMTVWEKECWECGGSGALLYAPQPPPAPVDAFPPSESAAQRARRLAEEAQRDRQAVVEGMVRTHVSLRTAVTPVFWFTAREDWIPIERLRAENVWLAEAYRDIPYRVIPYRAADAAQDRDDFRSSASSATIPFSDFLFHFGGAAEIPDFSLAQRQVHDPCGWCDGRGWVLSPWLGSGPSFLERRSCQECARTGKERRRRDRWVQMAREKLAGERKQVAVAAQLEVEDVRRIQEAAQRAAREICPKCHGQGTINRGGWVTSYTGSIPTSVFDSSRVSSNKCGRCRGTGYLG